MKNDPATEEAVLAGLSDRHDVYDSGSVGVVSGRQILYCRKCGDSSNYWTHEEYLARDPNLTGLSYYFFEPVCPGPRKNHTNT